MGFVGFRFLAGLIASFNRSMNRSIAAFLFAACVRCRWEVTRRTPAFVIRVPSLSLIRSRCASDNDGDPSTSNSNVTRVSNLLTFCPPGPVLREYSRRSSESGMRNERLISIMVGLIRVYHDPG